MGGILGPTLMDNRHRDTIGSTAYTRSSPAGLVLRGRQRPDCRIPFKGAGNMRAILLRGGQLAFARQNMPLRIESQHGRRVRDCSVTGVNAKFLNADGQVFDESDLTPHPPFTEF